MSTQEEIRKSSGAGSSAERSAIGQRIRDDLERSLRPERKEKVLPVLPGKGALPTRVGVGEWPAEGRGGNGGGIASPLTEASAAAREYWPDGLRSSDGLFILPAIKTLNLTDADGAAVQITLANPDGTA